MQFPDEADWIFSGLLPNFLPAPGILFHGGFFPLPPFLLFTNPLFFFFVTFYFSPVAAEPIVRIAF